MGEEKRVTDGCEEKRSGKWGQRIEGGEGKGTKGEKEETRNKKRREE